MNKENTSNVDRPLPPKIDDWEGKTISVEIKEGSKDNLSFIDAKLLSVGVHGIMVREKEDSIGTTFIPWRNISMIWRQDG